MYRRTLLAAACCTLIACAWAVSEKDSLSLLQPAGDVVVGLTPHEILQQNGLPPGLLPHAVANWTLSPKGDFVVHLTTPCTATADVWGGLPLRYDTVLKGNIKKGEITKLEGVIAEASAHLVWLNVITISVTKANSLGFTVTWSKLKFYTTIEPEVFARDMPCEPCNVAARHRKLLSVRT